MMKEITVGRSAHPERSGQPRAATRRTLIGAAAGFALAGCATFSEESAPLSPASAFLVEPLSATRFRIRIVKPVAGPARDHLMFQAAEKTLSTGAQWFEVLKRDARTIEFAIGKGSSADELAGGAKRNDARKTQQEALANLKSAAKAAKT